MTKKESQMSILYTCIQLYHQKGCFLAFAIQ